METIISLISNVGFPIAAYILMYTQCNTTIKENTKALQDLKNALEK